MKINIENYENMSTEEKLAALESYDPEKNGFVAKSVFDKTASDLSAAKKSLKDKMTEDEARAAQEAEERATLKARVEELEHERAVNQYVNTYLGMGYDEKLARSSAEALAKGDMNTVFENQKIHAANREKALRSELLDATPAPVSGTDSNVDYQAKISEAQASGDYTAAAYYTRLSAQDTN